MNVRKIACLGGGDLGVLLSVVIAAKCPEIRVIFADPDPNHIFKWNAKLMPEGNDPRLFDVLRKVQNKNLFFTTNEGDTIRESEILFLVTNPDVKDLGEGKGVSMNLTSIAEEAQVIVDHSGTDKIVVECSCIPQKATDYLIEFFYYNGKPNICLSVVCNPVFFDRKIGLKSVLFPERVMLGVGDSGEAYSAAQVLSNIFERWVQPNRIIMKSIPCVEITQIASHALIGQKIASLCSLKAICDKVNRPVKKFVLELQKDSQVGGFSDLALNIGKLCNAIKILSQMYSELNQPELADYWREILKIFANEEITGLELMMQKVWNSTLQVTIFGFSQDDTLVPGQSLKVCNLFLNHNVTVQIYDPKMSKSAVESELALLEGRYSKVGLQSKVFLCDDPYKAARESQVLLIHSYREGWLDVDFKRVFQEMKKPAHLYDHFRMLLEKEVSGIGFEIFECFPVIPTD